MVEEGEVDGRREKVDSRCTCVRVASLIYYINSVHI